nr:flap endonuclease gen-like 1 [Quercus suber]
MGVGGLWDLLKPYARLEGPDFLVNKRVAVDLSFWIVQHETAIKARVRNPHLRLTFFRTINLFSKFGAFPVFVTDGTPSPLKSRARIARFLHASGIDLSDLPVAEEGVSIERNTAFSKCVQECVELLELFADSDAFLFGAKCVIKFVRPNSKEPFECYHMSDIEASLGLKREHLIAISLLVGNDHDLNGVQGIGLDTALRFVQAFSEDEILNRLHEIGSGDSPIFQGIGLDTALRFVQAFSEDEILNRLHEIGSGDSPIFQGAIKSLDDCVPVSSESSLKIKCSHCSLCGHPGSKRAHFKFSCEYCSTSSGEVCMKKPEGFKCDCSSCDMDRREKEQKKQENWRIKVCNKIAMESNFPNDEIIKMYLCSNNGDFTEKVGPCISWGSPNTEMLVDFLAFHQHWEPSYIRRMMLPMLSTVFLREMAINPELKESKRKKSSSLRSEGTNEKSELKSSRGVQLSITEFYRSTKVQIQLKPGEDLPRVSDSQGDGTSKEKRKVSNPNLSKSVRRRLLFN